MRATHRLTLITALALAAPASLAYAQSGWGRPSASPAETEGRARGIRAGQEDGRRGQSFDYRDELDYRRADTGYRSQYGSLDRYRDLFRLGFERGYSQGYAQYRGDYGYGRGNDGRWGGQSGWGNGRGYGRGGYGVPGRYDLAFQNGFTDGYERGLDDGRDERRFDPVGEGRYRDGDHGYKREYGPKDVYRARYRDAFRDGYASGYNDGVRYDRDRRDDDRRWDGRPWWWPFQ